MMRKKRAVEPSDDRKRRLEDKASKRDEDARAEDHAIDEMVKRSIEKHGA
jgi:hypothetical protein